MLFLASARSSMSAGSLVVLAAFCAALLAFGIAHYRGWHRTWLRWLPFDANFFLPAWFGACGLMTVLVVLVGRISAALEAILALPTFAVLVITLMSLVWLPRRLLPAWYLNWRAQGRPPSGLIT